jgi:hypothetical protein
MIVLNTAPTMKMAPNTNDKEDEFDNYEDYVSNLPMGVEPISKDDFYKRYK